MTDFELGWVVGFLEGEGTFRGVGPNILVAAPQAQREPLDRIQRYTGLGRIRGPYKSPSVPAHHSPIYKWQVNGRAAAALMRVLRPHMSPKRQVQIDAAFATYEIRPRRDDRANALKAWVTKRARAGRPELFDAARIAV